MAEAPAAPKGKKNSKVLYIGLGAAGLVGFYLYRRSQASSAAAAQGATSAGNTIPIGGTTTSGSTGSSALPTFSSVAAWEQAAIAAMTGSNYSATQAYNDLQAWMSGNCVSSQGFNSLSSVITSVGLPPGAGSGLGPLTVCPGATPPVTTPPVTTSPSLLQGATTGADVGVTGTPGTPGQTTAGAATVATNQVGALMSGQGLLPAGVTLNEIASNPGNIMVTTAAGQTMNWLNPTEAANQPAGTPQYWQPTPGVFQQIVPGVTNLALNTPLYSVAA